MSSVLNLNEGQTKAYMNLRKFIKNNERHNFLLLGPAGSGKTTVIVNTFNMPEEYCIEDSSIKNNIPQTIDDQKIANNQLADNQSVNDRFPRIAFCAFTNKATQVLKKIADKFDINFKADFMTIHKLLSLELKYLDKETEVSFKFDKTKVANLKEYDVIIFDECSTISKELYQYIKEAWEYIDFAYNHKIKYIFLGDFWQLPPVGEENSSIFQIAQKEKWLISKLEKVMRASNSELQQINANLLTWVNKFKSSDKSLTQDFVHKYPYNLMEKIMKSDAGKSFTRYLSNEDLLNRYIETWKTRTSNTVILTYSRSNCDKTNQAIQDRVDDAAGREIPEKRARLYFYKGDRCCIDRPIEVYSIRDKKKNKINLDLLPSQDIISPEHDFTDMTFDMQNINIEDNISYETKELRTVMLDSSTTEMLYNGEIFDVLDVEDVSVSTPLNRFQYMPKYFEAQILKISNISYPEKTYEIIHINEEDINKARYEIKLHERRMFYLNIMSDFIKKYPKLDYGYCITIYKSQGSEWDTVFVNLNSIKWSIIGQNNTATFQKKMTLFKSSYTAMTRASNRLYCFWSA